LKRIAIITARGGSKRILKKNIKDFCGKPIMAYSIEAAKATGIFDTIMVSTDSGEIAAVALEYGAEVPFMRSAETSNDYAVTADVLREVILKYQDCGMVYDQIFCLYPTAPFVTTEKLIKSAKILDTDDYGSVFPVVKFGFPPQRGVVIKNGYLKISNPEDWNTRSQDLTPIYHDCGAFYAIKTKAFLEANKLITENTYPLICNENEVQDIDTLEDWELAEMKYKLMRAKL
jgi:N-acylneuraminate cytidylyltransferase